MASALMADVYASSGSGEQHHADESCQTAPPGIGHRNHQSPRYTKICGRTIYGLRNSNVMLEALGNNERLVQEGYDKIASRYLEWSVPSPARIRYLDKLLKSLPSSAEVLELGCGAGTPCTQALCEQAQVTGVDISAAQIKLAKVLVPKATLIQADMMSLRMESSSFDAVVAFYSLIHLPREKQPVLLTRIFEWVRPGGFLLANFGTMDDPESIDPDWLGTQMYWSSYDAQKNIEMVLHAGFDLIEAEVLTDDEDGNPVPFLWVFAKKKD